MRLFIFGAGSSCGTLGLPAVAGFGRALASKVPNWRTKFGALGQIVDAVEARYRRGDDDWDLAAAWTHVDYVAKLHEALDVAPFPPSGSHGLHAAVVTVYGKIEQQIDQAKKEWTAKGDYTLRHVLGLVQEEDCVVSFNYDTLVESLLVHRHAGGNGPKLVQAPDIQLNGAVQFAKPHGSVTWNRYKLDEIADNGGPRLEPVLDPEAIINEPKTDPLIVGAVPIKSELIKEVGTPGGDSAYPVVMKQWGALLRAVTEADELCVVGYSFPPEDEYGRFLIRQAARRRRRPIRRVELYELDDCVPRVRDSILEVLCVSPLDVAPRGAVSRCSGLMP